MRKPRSKRIELIILASPPMFSAPILRNEKKISAPPEPEHTFSKYRRYNVYPNFKDAGFSEGLRESVFFSGGITSVNELIDICNSLHRIKDKLEKNATGLAYKKRGFTLPKHMRYWFRGHADSSYGLVPSIFRAPDLAAKEDLLIKEFLLKNPLPEGADIFEILTKMRRYGYPTRLLDWTSDIMAAAYFACDENGTPGEAEKDGMLWVLEPYGLNLANRASKELGGIALVEDFDAQLRGWQSLAFNFLELENDYGDALTKAKKKPSDYALPLKRELLAKSLAPIAVDPGRLNGLLAGKQCKFTIGGGRCYQHSQPQGDGDQEGFFSEPKQLVPQEKKDVRGGYLSNFVIPKQHKKKIREDLHRVLGTAIERSIVDLPTEAKVTLSRLAPSSS